GGRFTLGPRSVDWSEPLQLSASQALSREAGRCVFGYAYVVENAGKARSISTDSSLVLARRLDLQLDAQPLRELAPGETQRVQGRLALPPGRWRVFAHADSSSQVAEWDGRNNA